MEWMAYASLEPFGVEVDFLGHAITASTIANVNRPKGQKPYSTEDFMPKFRTQTQTPDEMMQVAKMFTAALRSEIDDG